MPGARVGGRKREFLFKGFRVPAGEEEKASEVKGGDVTRTTSHRTEHVNGKLYVMYILLQFLKGREKKNNSHTHKKKRQQWIKHLKK